MQNPGLKNAVIIILLLVAVVGFADATYLTAKHYLDDPVTCSILEGCETVTTSKYATLFGIPIALFGSLYYLTSFFLLFLYREGIKGVLNLFAALTVLAFLITLYLLYLQIFVLEALCLFCLGSATTSTLLFFGALYLLNSHAKKK